MVVYRIRVDTALFWIVRAFFAGVLIVVVGVPLLDYFGYFRPRS